MPKITTAEEPVGGLLNRSVNFLRQKRHSQARTGWASYWFVVPIIAVFVVLFLIPLIESVYYSFTDFNGYVAPSFVGFANYIAIWSDPSMLSALGFTLIFAISTTIIVTLLAIPLALAFNRKFFARSAVRSVFFFPAVPSVAILGLVWGFILNPLGSGALNSLISLIGLAPIPWTSNGVLAQVSVIIVAVWSATGWHAMLYLAYLQAIPTDIFEAADIDGASRWKKTRYLTIPLLTPAMAISQLLLLTGGLKVYDLPFTLTKGGPGFSTRTLTQSIIESGIAQGEYGKASALAVLFLIVVGLIVVAQLVFSQKIQDRYS